MNKFLITALYLLTSWIFQSACQTKLKVSPFIEYDQQYELPLKEPSGLSLSSDGKSLWTVSDRGDIVNINFKGEELRSEKIDNRDWEAILAIQGRLYVVDEQQCRVYIFDEQTLNLLEEHDYKHPGLPNIGFEGIAQDSSGQLILAHERMPSQLHLIDIESMQPTAILPIHGFGDIAGLSWHDDRLWLLSDVDQRIIRMKANLSDGAEQSWRIRAKQPEGIVFLPDGRAAVVAEGCNCLLIYSLK